MRLVFEHVCSAPLAAVYAFFSNPAGLGLIYRERPEFRLLRHAGHVQSGAETWVEQTMFGCIPVVLGFRHVLWQPPHSFAEQSIHGPFKRFVHTHEFEPRLDGTLVRDTLDIDLPWHFGGAIGTRLIAAPLVRRMFAWRTQMLDRLIAQGTLSAARRDDVAVEPVGESTQ